MWKMKAFRNRSKFLTAAANFERIEESIQDHESVGWIIAVETNSLIVLIPGPKLLRGIRAMGWYAVIFWRE